MSFSTRDYKWLLCLKRINLIKLAPSRSISPRKFKVLKRKSKISVKCFSLLPSRLETRWGDSSLCLRAFKGETDCSCPSWFTNRVLNGDWLLPPAPNYPVLEVTICRFCWRVGLIYEDPWAIPAKTLLMTDGFEVGGLFPPPSCLLISLLMTSKNWLADSL